jgi:hypothetical protein
MLSAFPAQRQHPHPHGGNPEEAYCADRVRGAFGHRIAEMQAVMLDGRIKYVALAVKGPWCLPRYWS